MNLAPVGISTYARPAHLRRTLEALQSNTFARDTEVFVFSDAPRKGDEDKVAQVRALVTACKGFKRTHLIARETNNRIENNRGGMRRLLDAHGRLIFLEEDVVTAPNFLVFMNQALERYADNASVFSITGYCPPIRLPDGERDDAFFLRRFNAWGFGIWKDRFDRIRYVSSEEYKAFAANKERVSCFIEAGGKDMLTMLALDAHGKIDGLDVKAMYAQFLSDQYTLYPRQSLTRNVGMDGTGLHSARTDKFDVCLSSSENFVLPDDVRIDPRIVAANQVFRKGPGFWLRQLHNMSRMKRRLFGKHRA